MPKTLPQRVLTIMEHMEHQDRVDRIGVRIIKFNAQNAPAFCFVNEAKLLLSIFAKPAAKERKKVKAWKKKRPKEVT